MQNHVTWLNPVKFCSSSDSKGFYNVTVSTKILSNTTVFNIDNNTNNTNNNNTFL